MIDGKYLFTKLDNIYFVKLIGNLKYSQSECFNEFIEDIFKKKDFTNVLIDLREAQFLDSTNLGLIAKITANMIKLFDTKATIISTNPEINFLLKNIGFYTVFIIVEECDFSNLDLIEISTDNPKEKQMAKMILEAHEHLMNLNDENKKTFKNVVELFRAQSKKEES